MKKPLGPLTAADIRALRWAISEAATLRGAMTGGPNIVLSEFDRDVERAQAAVQKADAMRKAQRKETT
jgi:hypothetical protein